MSRRETLLVGLLALLGALLLTRTFIHQPTYTDAYYHYNAAARLAQGQGLTDAYLWTYLGQPPVDTTQEGTEAVLETPSHLYWMPLTSIASGLSMAVFGVTYGAAQLPLILFYTGSIVIAYWLGHRLGGSRRHAIVAALLMLFSGFFIDFWGEVDTFAPYAFLGALCLVMLGLGAEQGRPLWFGLGGLLAGLSHLTRSDGLLFALIGLGLTVWPWLKLSLRVRALSAALLLAGYLLVMGPWFLRMTQIVGAPLPLGGLSAFFFTEYDDLFRYPPQPRPDLLEPDGGALMLAARLEAFSLNLQTFFTGEGWVALGPLMLIGLWRKRGAFTFAFALFALGIHLAMTFVFPHAGYRGGLFHAVAALMPWWAALAVVGLDAVVAWVAKRRRRWKAREAQTVFSVGMVLLALMLTVLTTEWTRSDAMPEVYMELVALLPDDARVLTNDPAALYYWTGIGGAVVPNEPPEAIARIACDYGITHVAIQQVQFDEDGQPFTPAIARRLDPILTAPPDFLQIIATQTPGLRLYTIDRAAIRATRRCP